MSRLAEIKNKYVNCPILEHLEGIDIIGMDSKDKNYLIQQAERAEKLQDQIDNKILPEIEKGWTENIRFRQALEQVQEMSKDSLIDKKYFDVVDEALKGESKRDCIHCNGKGFNGLDYCSQCNWRENRNETNQI